MEGGRVAAAEVLIATQAVRANIRDGKTHQLPTAIQTGQNVGMRSFTDSLFQLVQDGIVAPREAYLKAVDKVSLEQKFSSAGIYLDKSLVELPKPDTIDEFELSRADMNSLEFLKKTAWKLSTDRNSQARDGRKAVELIERAIQLGAKDAETFMTRAAAQAETGRFKEAVQNVKTAMKLARQENHLDCLRELPQHLNYYKKSRPHPGAVA
jgi:tetratricopeptide (TPR) repeat protein